MILNINILSAIKYCMWYVKKSYKMRIKMLKIKLSTLGKAISK